MCCAGKGGAALLWRLLRYRPRRPWYVQLKEGLVQTSSLLSLGLALQSCFFSLKVSALVPSLTC